jgi:hypothetical protein
MLRIFARYWAKKKYIFSQEVAAATNDLNAGLSLRLSTEKRALIEKLNKEADEMDARIKEVSEMEEKGYWLCENGHENNESVQTTAFSGIEIIPPLCKDCQKPAKFIKRDLMTGQEKYESDKERKEAEDIAKQKREQAKAEEENAVNGEKTAKYFNGLAANNRTIAERIRQL